MKQFRSALVAFVALVAALLVSIVPASAQQAVNPCVKDGGSCAPVTSTNGLPVAVSGLNFVNITTNTDTGVLGTSGVFARLVVNTGGTGSTAAVYDDGDGTCSSGLIATFATTALVSLELNAAVANGICVKTAGTGAANITVLWR